MQPAGNYYDTAAAVRGAGTAAGAPAGGGATGNIVTQIIDDHKMRVSFGQAVEPLS
jgi:hypothetical protein